MLRAGFTAIVFGAALMVQSLSLAAFETRARHCACGEGCGFAFGYGVQGDAEYVPCGGSAGA